MSFTDEQKAAAHQVRVEKKCFTCGGATLVAATADKHALTRSLSEEEAALFDVFTCTVCKDPRTGESTAVAVAKEIPNA